VAPAESARAAFELGGAEIAPGTRRTVEIPLSLLSNHTQMNLPVYVIHGRRDGPVLLLTAAVHGDEIIGVEIIRRILHSPAVRGIRGTLLAVPIVNVYGFITHSRYTPDRRDLNRSFPGSANGSLAAQLADVLMRELLDRSDYAIDLHSAARHRGNLPQVRGDLDSEGVRDLARSFAPPVVLHSTLRDGSLRQAAKDRGIPVLLYEAGEALRFDETAIRIGVRGIIGVMHKIGMLSSKRAPQARVMPVMSRSSRWVRAEGGGILRTLKTNGETVEEDGVLGIIADPFGKGELTVTSPLAGIIIGRTFLPVVNQGDALFHIAKVFDPDKAGDRVGQMEQAVSDDPVLDDIEIV
jgi:predicted deacylase